MEFVGYEHIHIGHVKSKHHLGIPLGKVQIDARDICQGGGVLLWLTRQ